MPRFYFHTEDGAPHPDEDGVELADETAARIEGVRYLGQMLEDYPEDLWRDGRFRLVIIDDRGRLVAALDLGVSQPGSVLRIQANDVDAG